jgi:CDP-paratose 2-epimerase
MKILITGSNGLIGSSCVEFFCKQDNQVLGIDNDSRSVFFGNESSTSQVGLKLKENYKNFYLYHTDISDKDSLKDIFVKNSFDLIIHTAAQPSHDKASEIPELDFKINAVATTYLLQFYREFCPSASFIFLSTNKVYGDNPNKIKMLENEMRFDFDDKMYNLGIHENLSIDNTTHSLFGASKLAADIMVQEYGKYFGLNTAVLRGGCLTGPLHAAAKQHGFLSYLIKSCIRDRSYEVIGYKGKQVRDQIHSFDVANMISMLTKIPLRGEIFNIGGGRENSASILEIIKVIEEKLSMKINTSYQEKPRIGDHICYYTDMSKLKTFLPKFEIKYSLHEIIDELIFYNSK